MTEALRIIGMATLYMVLAFAAGLLIAAIMGRR